jgi:K+-transporting ATPase ATPase B chain
MTIHPRPEISLFSRAILGQAVWESFKKLAPHLVMKNPVMFVVEVGAVLTTVLWLRDFFAPVIGAEPLWFTGQVSLWLWFTVVFANFAEAVAEGRGKAQAASLKKMRQEIMARKLEDGREVRVPASSLRKGDIVVAEAGDYIPCDGDVIEASPRWTSQPYRNPPRHSGSGETVPGDRRHRVLSDRIVVRITADPGDTFLDKMIALVEGAVRQKTPNEIALHILLVGLTIVFLIACVTLVPVARIPIPSPTVIAAFWCA